MTTQSLYSYIFMICFILLTYIRKVHAKTSKRDKPKVYICVTRLCCKRFCKRSMENTAPNHCSMAPSIGDIMQLNEGAWFGLNSGGGGRFQLQETSREMQGSLQGVCWETAGRLLGVEQIDRSDCINSTGADEKMGGRYACGRGSQEIGMAGTLL